MSGRERRSDDEIIIVRIPRKSEEGAIRPDFTDKMRFELFKESTHDYDPATETFLCVITVPKGGKAAFKQEMAKTNRGQEITRAKLGAAKKAFPKFDKKLLDVEFGIQNPVLIDLDDMLAKRSAFDAQR